MSPSTHIATRNLHMESPLVKRADSNEHFPTNSEFSQQCRAIGEHVVASNFSNLGQRKAYTGPTKRYGDKMVKLTDDMRTKHDILFRGMASRLELKSETVNLVFEDVANEIFKQEWNFGRVVSLYAFMLTMVKYCIDNDLESKIPSLLDMTAITLKKQEQVFLENAGWDGFLLHFTDTGEKLWRGILVTTISLGALATLLYART